MEKCDRCGGRLIAKGDLKAVGHTPGCFHSNRVKTAVINIAPRDAMSTMVSRYPAQWLQNTQRQKDWETLEEFREWLQVPQKAISPKKALELLQEEEVKDLLGEDRFRKYKRAAEALSV